MGLLGALACYIGGNDSILSTGWVTVLGCVTHLYCVGVCFVATIVLGRFESKVVQSGLLLLRLYAAENSCVLVYLIAQ